MRLTVLRCNVTGKGKSMRIVEGALILIEYIGNRSARKHLPQLNARDQQRGTNRTFPSTKENAFNNRKECGKRPINIAVGSRHQADPRRQFASNGSCRNACRGAASGAERNISPEDQTDVGYVTALLVDEAHAEDSNVPGHIRVVRHIAFVEGDIIIGCWGLNTLQVTINIVAQTTHNVIIDKKKKKKKFELSSSILLCSGSS
jgi:hypothetical protein